jgi:flagellar biosynthetic protein FliR
MEIPFTYSQLLSFFLVFVRIGSMLLVAPVFSVRFVPVRFRVGLAFFLSVVSYPMIVTNANDPALTQGSTGMWFILVVKEALTGTALGMVGAFMFAVFQMAGQLMDTQIGFSLSSVLDPVTGVQSSLFSNFKQLLAILLFLGMDGHHALIMGILQSFHYVPLGTFTITGNFLALFVQIFSVAILLGIKMAAPVVVALFLTDVAFAVLSKSVPQLNIFVVGLPFKIAAGLLILILCMAALVVMFSEMFHFMFDRMEELLRVMVKQS